ncbi:MAG TPA: AraC family transcriptional regulator, partial [Gemmataceae bacterium]
CLVRTGGYTERYGGRSRSCGPLTVAYHPPGETHSERFHEEEVRSFNIEVGPDWLARVRALAPALADPADCRGGLVAALALRLYREFRLADAHSGLAVEGLALELAAELGRLAAPSPRVPPWLARVRDLLHDRFAENLRLAELAAEAGVHPVHLAGTFRRHFGCSVGEFVRRVRVEQAARLLAGGDTPVAEVALAAGFADQSHLCRVFKRHTGFSPAAYRRQARQR